MQWENSRTKERRKPYLRLTWLLDAKQVITDIVRGEADLDTLKAGASLIPAAKITKVPKVVKAIGNVGKTGFKKGKQGEKIAKSGQAKQTKAKNKGALRNDSKSKYIFFNKTHKNSLPKPKGTGPNGGRLQSHHGLQQQWAIDNLSKYGYDAKLAPTVTIETGMEMPHTIISNLQNKRRDARVTSGNGKWSSSLQDELSYIVSDFREAGFSDSTINSVLEQQYKMLDKLNVQYERININVYN